MRAAPRGKIFFIYIKSRGGGKWLVTVKMKMPVAGIKDSGSC